MVSVRRSLLSTCLVAGLALVTACSTPAAQEGTTQATPEASSPVSAATTASENPGPQRQSLASAESSIDRQPVRIDLVSVHTSEAVTTVDFSVSHAGGADGKRIQVSQAFSDGISQKDSAGEIVDSDAFTADGVFLLDPKAAKRYLPGRGPDGVCVCSGNLSSTFVNPGQTIGLSAVFAGLPADTTTVSVFIPGAGTFDNVTVSR